MERERTSSSKRLAITVRTVKSLCFALALKPTETIVGIKRKLEKAEGTPIADQVLLYAGRVLDDQSTIESYHFRDGTTLDMEPPTVAIVLVGNAGVGKTSVLSNFVNPLSKLPVPAPRHSTWGSAVRTSTSWH